MLFRFIGIYSNNRTSMRICDHTFEGREPTEVSDPDSIASLSGHPEFELVAASEAKSVEVPVEPKRRGRPRKV
jgi:hypothetical protein